MTIRTTESWLTFRRPFTLEGSERKHPPGKYRVLTDEEPIEGLSFLAYRRVSTMIFLPGGVSGSSSMEMMIVDPGTLQAAQLRDDSVPEAASGTAN